MARKLAPAIDPTLPKVEVVLGGQKYFLCFTFAALATAEARLRDVGTRINLLHALNLTDMHAEQLVPVLFAAMLTHQPDITPEAVAKLVTFKSLPNIFPAIMDAYVASLADPADKDSGDAKQHPDEPQPK
jgi:hypothetical protein